MPLAQTFQLPDGRLLSYDAIGDSEGAPVIFFHGVPGSRRYWSFAGPDDVAAERGVRLISPDRPGIGRSSPAPRRSILDFADDVERLADALELERFGVLGFSGGAAYALATASRLPERVASVGLIAPVSDLSVPGLLNGLDPLTRKGLAAIAKAPAQAWRLPDRVDSGKLLTLAVNRVWSLLPSADRRALSLPRVKIAAARMLEEAARHGLEGVRHDVGLLMAPWGFDLSTVDAPVDVHVGAADPWSTPEMIHWLRVGLPSPRIRTYDGDGHFTILVKHSGEVLEGVLERGSLGVTELAMASETA